ncbi:UNVERIFIED_CONTAM: hypothetical protein GTU68_000497, partial [Idotea baltica]|nr:hypothetical protein [Idotea baltica]
FLVSLFDQKFLNDVWQQKAYLIRNAVPNACEIVDGSALKKLASHEDCESRIITGSKVSDIWQCQHGPFNVSDFVNFADKDWTLLVQGLDQWNDRAAQLLNQFSFLPQWRLEDIMASYAPLGGGVGPHFDFYDVFLIQASGSREWQLGQRCDHSTQLQDNDEVKLLAAFDCKDTHQVHAGDMLYIPAGMAHWGTATSDDCITLSVGFRAPS